MTHTNDATFAGSVPALYERYLVPLLFEPYAADLASRLAGMERGRLLELASGTGAVTSVLHQALPEVTIVATDLNEGMLALNRSRAYGDGVSWQTADAQRLPFEDASFDAVVCQFGVMFFPDKAASYREARRVLRDGGRYVFNVWNRVEDNEVTAIASRTVAALFPSDPPRFIERTPFGYFDVPTIIADVEGAGFVRVDVQTVEKVTIADSAESFAVGLCQGTPVRGEIEARDPRRLDEATRAVAAALTARFGNGPFDNRMSAHVVTAWRS
ncbi:MAG TPA: class I SAM-dependent methyltransferase [Polyangiaceae bacterium]|nr:class I SAM-dependent methyltransferase [Polyangiaceae bacterium]